MSEFIGPLTAEATFDNKLQDLANVHDGLVREGWTEALSPSIRSLNDLVDKGPRNLIHITEERVTAFDDARWLASMKVAGIDTKTILKVADIAAKPAPTDGPLSTKRRYKK